MRNYRKKLTPDLQATPRQKNQKRLRSKLDLTNFTSLENKSLGKGDRESQSFTTANSRLGGHDLEIASTTSGVFSPLSGT